MNHVYRVIWNGSAACWQAVSEIAHGKSKSRKSSTASTKAGLKKLALVAGVAAGMTASGLAMAVPTGAQFVSGSVGVSVNPTYTLIKQFSDRAIVNWNDFSIANGELVNIEQPDANSILLNRVVTSTPSVISGTLNANGRVLLVNPNGITFGSNAQVNVGSLIASSLDISDSDFNNDVYRFSSNTNNGYFVSQATMNIADGGTAAFISPRIIQAGTIVNNNGSILLTAAADVTLQLNNRELVSQTINAGHLSPTITNTNLGVLQADGGKVILTAQGLSVYSTGEVNNAGVIRAQTLAGNDRGSIDLITDNITGVIKLSGTLDASAPTNGFGGTIKTYGSDVKVTDAATVTTRKVNQSNLPGTSSYWQIKANSINVASGGTISGSKLGSSLNDGSVILTSAGTGTGQGSINIGEAVSSASNVILTLAATKDININSNISLTGALGRLVLSYGASNDYNLYNGSKINLSGSGATLRINTTDYTVINSLGVAGDTTTTTLQGIKNNLTGNYVLGSDIDASSTSTWNNGNGFQSIGSMLYHIPGPNVTQTGNAFSGQLHGLGHQVSNLKIKGSQFSMIMPVPGYGQVDVGLFGTLSGLVRDVHLVNGTVQGSSSLGAVGLLAGVLNGVVKNSSATGTVTSSGYAGGLVGADGTALGLAYIPAGLANISESSFSGTVNGSLATGGLIGSTAGQLSNSDANATVQGSSIKGGLAGSLLNSASVTNSYAQGTLSSGGTAGGLAGTASAGASVSNSFWNTTTSGVATSAGGTGKTTAELKQIATFTGWDIADVSNTTSSSTWVIDQNNATPWLR